MYPLRCGSGWFRDSWAWMCHLDHGVQELVVTCLLGDYLSLGISLWVSYSGKIYNLAELHEEVLGRLPRNSTGIV